VAVSRNRTGRTESVGVSVLATPVMGLYLEASTLIVTPALASLSGSRLRDSTPWPAWQGL